MKTVQMTLDEELVQAVDQVSKQLNTNRSAFTRQALRDALAKFNREQLEKKHREGYERNPVAADEFSIWESEQVWGDEPEVNAWNLERERRFPPIPLF